MEKGEDQLSPKIIHDDIRHSEISNLRSIRYKFGRETKDKKEDKKCKIIDTIIMILLFETLNTLRYTKK